MCQYSLVDKGGKEYAMDIEADLSLFSAFHFKNHNSKILIVDIDDTLRSSEDRKDFIPTPEKIAACGASPNVAWHEFNGMCYLDKPLKKNIDLVKSLILNNSGAMVLFLTSCTSVGDTAKITLAQLNSYGLGINCRNKHLVMRGVDNQESPLDFKKNFILGTKLQEYHDERVLCVDDNPDIIEMFQQFGFETIKV